MTKDSLIATLACGSFADAVYFITSRHPDTFTVRLTPLDDRLAYPDGHARSLGADSEKDTIIHHDVHRVVLNDPARERVLIGTVCAVIPPADEAPPWYVAVRYL